MPATTRATLAEAGKYLTFDLGEEHYGLEIMRVQEIVGMMPVTRMPRLPKFVAGVVNLRGRIVPVIDLRLSFDLGAAEVTDRTCIIVVRVLGGTGESTVMGLIVDQVSDVSFLGSDAIEPVPEFGTEIDTSFIKGVGRFDERVVLLLDIDAVLSSRDLDIVTRAAGAAAAEDVAE